MREIYDYRKKKTMHKITLMILHSANFENTSLRDIKLWWSLMEEMSAYLSLYATIHRHSSSQRQPYPFLFHLSVSIYSTSCKVYLGKSLMICIFYTFISMNYKAKVNCRISIVLKSWTFFLSSLASVEHQWLSSNGLLVQLKYYSPCSCPWQNLAGRHPYILCLIM